MAKDKLDVCDNCLIMPNGVTLLEALGIFLMVAGHGVTFPLLSGQLHRSTRTLFTAFDLVLGLLLQLYPQVVALPQPSPGGEYTLAPVLHQRKYSSFRHCLGALDGTHIPVWVPVGDQNRWRDRLGAPDGGEEEGVSV